MDDSFNPIKMEDSIKVQSDMPQMSNSAIQFDGILPESLSDTPSSSGSHRAQVDSLTPSIPSSLDFDREKSLTYEMLDITSPDYFEFFRTPSPSPFPSMCFQEPDFTKSLPEQIRRQILVDNPAISRKKQLKKVNDENNWVLLPSSWDARSKTNRDTKAKSTCF
jgi:hypothetical protein